VRISVWGLGSVGLPLAVTYALAGVDVVGIDINESHIEAIKKGNTHIQEPFGERSLNEVLRDVVGEKFLPTTDFYMAADANYHIVTVGIPLNEDGGLNWFPLESALHNLSTILKREDLVLLRATVVPGTTTGLAKQILESGSNLTAGRDFYLAYAPERIAEGRAYEEFRKMPTLVGGITHESTERAKEVLSVIVENEIIDVGDPWVAEMSKVLENASRDVNIALVNEIAKIALLKGYRPFSVIDAANTHPRVRLLKPGPGVGGHCIPNAYYYIRPLFDELGVESIVFSGARKVNDSMPLFVADYIDTKACDIGIPKTSKVAILGLAMKDFSYDDRHSPAHDIIYRLHQLGWTDIWAYDPLVPKRFEKHLKSLEPVVDGASIVVVAAKQDGIEPKRILPLLHKPYLVMDTRGVFADYPANYDGGRIVSF
jgi:UDP-N-acetyl-D-mannosaminuronic acid dehydrogenase